MYERQETSFSTSVSTLARSDALHCIGHIVDEWLKHQANDYRLRPVAGGPIEQDKNDHAAIFIRRCPEEISFAFAHDDEHDPAVSWHILGLFSQRNDRVRIDIDVKADGVPARAMAPLGMPTFMATIVEDIGLVDDERKLSVEPVRIGSADGLAFAQFLISGTRELPILAFSEPLPMLPDEMQRIARRVAGAAHVAFVETSGSFAISDSIGKPFSVYNGAARVYPPKLPTDPRRTRLYFAATIERYNSDKRPNPPFGVVHFSDVIARATLDRNLWPNDGPNESPEAAATVTPPPAESVESIPSIIETVDDGTITSEPKADAPNAFEAPTTSRDASTINRLAKIAEEMAGRDRPLTTTSDDTVKSNGPADRDLVGTLRQSIGQLENRIEELRRQRNAATRLAASNEDHWFNAQAELERLQQESHEVLGATPSDNALLASIYANTAGIHNWLERLVALQARLRDVDAENDQLRRELENLRWTITSLQQRDESQISAVQPPEDYHDVVALQRYLTDRYGESLILHSNAMKTLKEGLFADSPRLIGMFDLLGGPFSKMKSSTGTNGDARKIFEAARDTLHLKYSPALRSGTSIGQYGQHYAVQWNGRSIDAREIMHIRVLGENYAPERMGALYFFWDDVKHAVVVTSGPSKLPTAADHT